ERVLRDRRERQPADRDEREPAEPFRKKRRAEKRGEEEPRLEQVRDAEEAARQLGANRRERERRGPDEHRCGVGPGQDAERQDELRPPPEERRPEEPPGDR